MVSPVKVESQQDIYGLYCLQKFVVKGRHLGNSHVYVQCIIRRASVYVVRDNLLGCSMIDWLQYD